MENKIYGVVRDSLNDEPRAPQPRHRIRHIDSRPAIGTHSIADFGGLYRKDEEARLKVEVVLGNRKPPLASRSLHEVFYF